MDKDSGNNAKPEQSESDQTEGMFAMGEQAPPFWTCAGLRHRRKSIDWVSGIFAQEFGVSDVQANYTRVYAWMANQLGHMTLGLAGALLFVWIAETITSALEYYAAKANITGAAQKICQWGEACRISNFLLMLTVGGVVGGICWAFYQKLRANEAEEADLANATTLAKANKTAQTQKPSQADETTGFPHIPLHIARWTYLAMPALLLGVIFGAIIRMHIDDALGGVAEQAGLLTATVVIAAAIVFLSKDAQVLAISVPAMAIVLIIGTGVLNNSVMGERIIWGHKLDLKWEFLAVLALMILLVRMLYQNRYCGPAYEAMSDRGANLVREYYALAFFAVFLVVFAFGLQDDWRLALTAAFASTTLWWVKEFGSDIPGVHDEISRARAKRPPVLDGAPDATVKDFESVELDYMTDARMDARTDGLFYIAGAWIGAGIISGQPVLSDQSWSTGAELVGCLIFLLFFLAEGKRWSYRQVALDRMGATRASRLAVFYSAIKMAVIERGEVVPTRRGDDGPALDQFQPDPITALDNFARATVPDGEERIDHIIVFGPLGSGRTPLGLAIASEASLASLSTADDRNVAKTLGDERRGRYIRMQRLSHLLERATDVSELMGFPTQPVWFNKKGERVPEGAADAEREEKAADIVVIDDVSLSGEVSLVDACAQLNMAAGQQTVWMLNVKTKSDYAPMTTEAELRGWQPDHQNERITISTIQEQIEKWAGKPQRIAVIYVRPYLANGTVQAPVTKEAATVILAEEMTQG